MWSNQEQSTHTAVPATTSDSRDVVAPNSATRCFLFYGGGPDPPFAACLLALFWHARRRRGCLLYGRTRLLLLVAQDRAGVGRAITTSYLICVLSHHPSPPLPTAEPTASLSSPPVRSLLPSSSSVRDAGGWREWDKPTSRHHHHHPATTRPLRFVFCLSRVYSCCCCCCLLNRPERRAPSPSLSLATTIITILARLCPQLSLHIHSLLAPLTD